MFRRCIVPIIALVTAFGSFSAVLAKTEEDIALHTSAWTLEEHVAARRAARLAGPTAAVRWTTRRPTGGTPEDFRLGRLRRRRIQAPVRTPVRTVVPPRQATAEERREARRQERLQERPEPITMQVVDAVNYERAKLGIFPLTYAMKLETSAQRHAEDMKTRDYFSHENPEGERSGDRIKKTGYGVVNAQECRCSYKVFLGENIAKGQVTIPQVIREWMASQAHREAMLSKDYKEIGVGKVDDIWVLNFGSVEITPH